jgi:hypothetical protein
MLVYFTMFHSRNVLLERMHGAYGSPESSQTGSFRPIVNLGFSGEQGWRQEDPQCLRSEIYQNSAVILHGP